MTYSGGDGTWCPGGRPRTISLQLVCALTQPSPAAYSSVSVIETNTCSYSVQLPSIAGCPTQCRAPGDTKLCSGNGVCGYNSDAMATQCFCYNGFTGGNCASTVSVAAGLGVEGVLLIIVCIILAGVIGLTIFMLLKLRKLNVNPSSLSSLDGKCESRRALSPRSASPSPLLRLSIRAAGRGGARRAGFLWRHVHMLPCGMHFSAFAAPVEPRHCLPAMPRTHHRRARGSR